MKRWVPITTEAFIEHRMESASLSRTALAAVKRMIAGETVTAATSASSAPSGGNSPPPLACLKPDLMTGDPRQRLTRNRAGRRKP